MKFGVRVAIIYIRGPGINYYSDPELEKEDALAGALAVELAVGLVGLLEAPAVGEDALERNALFGDELGALAHAHGAEGPGADEGDLAAQQVRAHVERHVAAFADVAG